MKKIIISAFLAVVWSFSLTGSAYAYLDPVTGSILLQGLVGGFAAASAAIGLYWEKVKTWFGSIFGSTGQKIISEQKGSAE